MASDYAEAYSRALSVQIFRELVLLSKQGDADSKEQVSEIPDSTFWAEFYSLCN